MLNLFTALCRPLKNNFQNLTLDLTLLTAHQFFIFLFFETITVIKPISTITTSESFKSVQKRKRCLFVMTTKRVGGLIASKLSAGNLWEEIYVTLKFAKKYFKIIKK